MKTLHILLVTAAVFILKNTEVAGYKRVCYYTNWSQYRKGDGHFMPSDIEANLCTHIIFAFAKLSGNSLATIEPNDKQLYQQLVALKAQNPSLKVTLAVGGWTAGSAPFSRMAATQAGRSAFIQSTISFLRANNLDGLDIDWEYPANRGGAAADKQNFGLLLKEMRTAFEQESSSSGKDRLLISVAVGAGKSTVDSGYDVKTIGQNVDFINLMSYDFHGPWEGKAGQNSPLYAKSSETGAAATQNTAWAANYWAQNGAPKEKIIVGVSFYGKAYSLASSANHDVGAQITGAAPAGPFTGENGVLSYYETCKKQEAGGTTYWEKEQRVPYYVNGNLWVGYDDVRSISQKASFVKREGFGGLMVWAIDGDDFKKICSSSPSTYPLLKAIGTSLGVEPEPVTNAPTKATTTTKALVTNGPTTAQPWTPKPTTGNPGIPTSAAPWAPKSTTRNPGIPTSAAPWAPKSTTRNLGIPTSAAPWAPKSTTRNLGIPTSAAPWAPQPTDGPITNMPDTNAPTNPPPTTASWQKPTTTLDNHPANATPLPNHAGFTCTGLSDGYYSDPSSCNVFHRCNGEQDYHYSCTTGTQYNPKLHECDWPYNVKCTVSR